MKSVLVLALGLIGSTSFAAVVDGSYHCASPNNTLEITYNIKTLTTGGVKLPYLEVTQTYGADATTPSRTYVLKGIATTSVDDAGQERLFLGNMTISLTNGRPSCSVQ